MVAKKRLSVIPPRQRASAGRARQFEGKSGIDLQTDSETTLEDVMAEKFIEYRGYRIRATPIAHIWELNEWYSCFEVVAPDGTWEQKGDPVARWNDYVGAVADSYSVGKEYVDRLLG